MQIIFIDLEDVVETIQLCSGPTDIWAQFSIPPAPWTSGRTVGDAKLSFNGHYHDAADAIILDTCEIFVAGYVFWDVGYGFSEYSRVFTVSTNGGGSYSTLADFYPYQAGTQSYDYDPLNPFDQTNSVALANDGSNIYVLHNTADGSPYQNSNTIPVKNYLITSKTTDLGNTWTHNISTTNQISTTAAIYTNNGLFHVGGDAKTNLENDEFFANLYISHSTDEGNTWALTKALDNTVAYAVNDYGYAPLATSVANVNNYCGVMINGYSATVPGNAIIYYLNPTSNNTWDIKVLYDHDSTDSNYYYQTFSAPDYNRVKLLPLKSQPGTILAFYGDYGSKIHRFRSTDSGNTWSSVSQVYPIAVFDEVTPEVTLTRWTWGPLINIKQESYPSWSTSPLGTEWNADGWTDLSNVTTRTYDTFEAITAQGPTYGIGNNIKNKNLVMRATSSNRYFKFKFTNWGNASTGASFVYNRQEIDPNTGSTISGLVTVTKPVFETVNDIDIIGWGPNFDAVELADGNVVVVFCADVPGENFDAIKYMISTDGGSNFNQHGWASNATTYQVNFSDKFNNYGYKALASGNDIVLVGATYDVNNAIRFTPVAGSLPPQQPPVPMTAPMILKNDPTWINTTGITLHGPYNLLVDWGDGNSNVYYDGGPGYQTFYHDYTTNTSIKTISIQGQVASIEFPQFNASGYTELSDWGTLMGLNNVAFTFCTNLTSVPDHLYASITSLKSMFTGCTNFNDANVINWDTSNVTSLNRTFAPAPAFNQNIGSWNTSNVVTIREMFEGATAFNQNISSWDTSKVADMSGVFQLSAFNQNISSWNTSNVTTMFGMFAQTPFNQNISSWNTSSVTDMGSMFYINTVFNQNISTWDTGNVTNMNNMFYSATAFNQDISTWDTSNVTSMGGMFTNATLFNQNLSPWCVSNIPIKPVGFDTGANAWTTPRPVWGACPTTPLPSVSPLSMSFSINTLPANNVYIMTFTGSNVNVWVDWNDGTNPEHITSAGPVYHSYNSWGAPGDPFSSFNIKAYGEFEGFRVGDTPSGFGLVNRILDWGNPTGFNNLSNAFANTYMQSVPATLHPNVTNLSYAFSNVQVTNPSNVTLWNTSNVTNMEGMFSNTNAFNRNIGAWDTGNVINMNYMFNNATAFNQNLTGWCVTNITTEPTNFSTGSPLSSGNKPVWGTCP